MTNTKGASRTKNGSEVEKLRQKVKELENRLKEASTNWEKVRCLSEDGDFHLDGGAEVEVCHYGDVGISLSAVRLGTDDAEDLADWLLQYAGESNE